MKTNNLKAIIIWGILSIPLYTLFGCASNRIASYTYIKGYTNSECIYITKADFLAIVKERYPESFQKVSSALKTSNCDFKYLYIPKAEPIKLPEGLNDTEAILYITFMDNLPILLQKHKVLIYDINPPGKRRKYYYKRDHGILYFFLSDGTPFYSCIETIID